MMRATLLTCFLLFAFAGLGEPLAAQEAAIKPIMVTAVAPVDDLLADADYLAKVFGAEDSAKMIRQVVGPFLGGIDRKRPWGAYLSFNDEEPLAVGFIPVTSLKVELAILEEQIGKAEELDGGVFKVSLPATGEGAPQELYLKELNGWAFYSDKAENLVTLPKDPVALLGGLEKKYDLGTRIVFENISAEDRQKAVDEIKKQIEASKAMPMADAPDVPEEFVRAMEEMVLNYAEGTRWVDFGFTVDREAANISLSLAVEPIAGSELAKTLASVKTLTSKHSGVLAPGAAVVIHRVARFSKDDIAMWNVFIDQMIAESTKTPPPVGKEAVAKDGLQLVERIAKSAYVDGQVDWGTSYLVSDDGKLTTISGGHLVGLKDLEAEMRAFLEKHKAEDVAKITVDWDFAKHGKVRIIKLTPPADQPFLDADVLGEDPSAYLGIDDDYVYFVNGQDAVKHLKAAIDRSAARPAFKAAPFRMRIDVRPLTKLAVKKLGADDPVIERLMTKLDAASGKTSLHVNLLPGEAGLEGRFEIGEGVLTIMPEVGQLMYQAFTKATQPMIEPEVP